MSARIGFDVAGPKDFTGAGQCRKRDGRACCLVYSRSASVTVWVWYPEYDTWSYGSKPLAWWKEATPCDLPEGVESPL